MRETQILKKLDNTPHWHKPSPSKKLQEGEAEDYRWEESGEETSARERVEDKIIYHLRATGPMGHGSIYSWVVDQTETNERLFSYALSHLIHRGLVANEDGSYSLTDLGLTAAKNRDRGVEESKKPVKEAEEDDFNSDDPAKVTATNQEYVRAKLEEAGGVAADLLLTIAKLHDIMAERDPQFQNVDVLRDKATDLKQSIDKVITGGRLSQRTR